MDIDYIMSTIADKLQDLVTAKEDMKTALVEKGVTPTGGLSTYADAVLKLQNTNTYLPIGTKFAYTKFNHIGDVQSIVNNINPNETDMSDMFLLTTIPNDPSEYWDYPGNFTINTTGVTNMCGMFDRSCISYIPDMDTSSVTDMSYMCYYVGKREAYSYKKTYLPSFDCSNVTNISNFFYDSTGRETPNVVQVGQFTNLGKQRDLVGTNIDGFLRGINITKSEIVNILQGLYDRNTAGYSILTLKLSDNTLSQLSDTQISIATKKGWNLSK